MGRRPQGRRLAGTEAWKLEVLSSREVASEDGRADRPTDWGGGHQQGGAHLQFGSRIREGLRVGLRLPPWLRLRNSSPSVPKTEPQLLAWPPKPPSPLPHMAPRMCHCCRAVHPTPVHLQVSAGRPLLLLQPSVTPGPSPCEPHFTPFSQDALSCP